MKAQMPPFFCPSATQCSASVVLPEDSGPQISTIRPLGRPPTPSAMSSPSEPEEIVSISIERSFLPSFITEPLPNCRSIWESAADSAFDLSMEEPSTIRRAGADMGSAPYGGIRSGQTAENRELLVVDDPYHVCSLFAICSFRKCRFCSYPRPLAYSISARYQPAAWHRPIARLAFPCDQRLIVHFGTDRRPSAY